MKKLFLFLFLLCITAPALASEAVFLMYHRFGEAAYPATSVTLDQFEDHIEYLKDNNFNIMPVPEIVSALKNNTSLPEKTIGITIDDAFKSVYNEAWPILRRSNVPFTLFVSPATIGGSQYMSWADLQKLAKDKNVTIGNHTEHHTYMTDKTSDQNKQAVAATQQQLRDFIGVTPTLFSYPYGEYGIEEKQQIRKTGLKAAFGQQSGAASSMSDMYALPRFAMNENYADMDRFKLVVNTRALPVSEVTPENTRITKNPPSFGFTVDSDVAGLDTITCYASEDIKTTTEVLGNRVEIRLKDPFVSRRGRINCTLRHADGNWYWFGEQFSVPAALR